MSGKYGHRSASAESTVRLAKRIRSLGNKPACNPGVAGAQVPAIVQHLANIFASGELVESSVVSILETTAADGKSVYSEYSLEDLVKVRKLASQ